MQIIRNLLFLNNLQGINRLAITLTCHRKFIKSVPRRPTEGKKKKKKTTWETLLLLFLLILNPKQRSLRLSQLILCRNDSHPLALAEYVPA